MNFTSELLCMCVLMQYFITQSCCFLWFFFSRTLLPHSEWVKFVKLLILQSSSSDISDVGIPTLFFPVYFFKLILRKHLIYVWDLLRHPSLQISRWIISRLLERWHKGSTIKACKILNGMKRVNRNLCSLSLLIQELDVLQ